MPRDRLVAALSQANTKFAAKLQGDEVPVDAPLIPAAVLIAVTDRREPGLILTQRPTHLRRHAGQIALPGGRADAEDSDSIATALREAQEEIGLDPTDVEIIGTTDVYQTGTGFIITPVVGIIPPDLQFTADEIEVAEIFEVPFAYVMDPANQVLKTGLWQGHMRNYYEITWQERRIWGATAGMLVNLAARLR